MTQAMQHYADSVRLLERERELDVLREGLRQVRDGLGVGIAVAGDSGTGKSSTIAAAVREASGLRVLRGQCDPLGTPRPLGPFRELALPDLVARVTAPPAVARMTFLIRPLLPPR